MYRPRSLEFRISYLLMMLNIFVVIQKKNEFKKYFIGQNISECSSFLVKNIYYYFKARLKSKLLHDLK